VAAFKPAVTGLDEDADPAWPRDHELLADASGAAPKDVTPHTFGLAASPHLAASLAGAHLEPPELLAGVRAAASGADVLVVEGVGGLLVPLTLGYSIRDFAVDLGLPLVVVARPGLGTINHTLLTIEAVRGVGLAVAAVVLTPWADEPSTLELSNRETIERLGGVRVETLPELELTSPESWPALILDPPERHLKAA
jgi:dethiobiotin synthetase